jgi:hypothetical protein
VVPTASTQVNLTALFLWAFLDLKGGPSFLVTIIDAEGFSILWEIGQKFMPMLSLEY